LKEIKTMALTIEQARRYVLSFTAARKGKDDEVIEKTAARMVATGECAWHALSQVTGSACWCADCRPDVRRFA
jgi:hypothetical protein